MIKCVIRQNSPKYVWIFSWLCRQGRQNKTKSDYFSRILHECLIFRPTLDKYAGVGIINGCVYKQLQRNISNADSALEEEKTAAALARDAQNCWMMRRWECLLRHRNSNWLSSEFKDTELPLCAAAKNEKIWSCRFLGSGMFVFWCIAAVICPESATSGLKTFSTHGRTRLWVPSIGANVARNTFSSWKYCSSATNDHSMQSYVEGQDVMNGEERKGNNLEARDLLTASLCTHQLLDIMTTFEAFTCFVPWTVLMQWTPDCPFLARTTLSLAERNMYLVPPTVTPFMASWSVLEYLQSLLALVALFSLRQSLWCGLPV